jgi:hypothetical protein
VTVDLYVWSAPHDLDAERAEVLVADWLAAGGDPAASPFEPSTDVGWFYRELIADAPGIEAVSDAAPSGRRTPVWMSSTDEPPARVVGLRLPPETPGDALSEILGLAAKYDLVIFDARSRRLHLPLDELAAHASATFWPGGAVQAAVAGGVGGLVAVGAWLLGIPIVSGVVALVGGFMFVMAMYTFVHEGRRRLRGRGSRGASQGD